MFPRVGMAPVEIERDPHREMTLEEIRIGRQRLFVEPDGLRLLASGVEAPALVDKRQRIGRLLPGCETRDEKQNERAGGWDAQANSVACARVGRT